MNDGPTDERPAAVVADELTRRLRGTRVLATGANGGVGRGVAAVLADAGCRVVATDVQPDTTGDDGRISYRPADLTDADATEGLVDVVIDELGGIDLVVNSAGIGHVDPLESLPMATWQRVFAINVEAALRLSQLAVRQMSIQDVSERSERRGLIIHVSSAAAEVGRPLLAAYGASKAALNHLSKSLAVTFAERSIATAVVAPGHVPDGMLRYLMPAMAETGGPEYAEDRLLQARLFDLEQTPAEVGRLVAALASRPGMSMNGMELWTTPTIRPIA